ncbi:MAG: hypothetical protein QG635_855, partial [Bacteroidota bacterium]|nr:hypothetical protein [Bacteroidota bacterium]
QTIDTTQESKIDFYLGYFMDKSADSVISDKFNLGFTAMEQVSSNMYGLMDLGYTANFNSPSDLMYINCFFGLGANSGGRNFNIFFDFSGGFGLFKTSQRDDLMAAPGARLRVGYGYWKLAVTITSFTAFSKDTYLNSAGLGIVYRLQ